MAILVAAVGDSGRTLFATLQQITASGTRGLIWDVTGAQWASNPAVADRKITLTEGTSPNLGMYTGGISGSVSTYTGQALLQVHDDDDADTIVGGNVIYIDSSSEARDATIADADDAAAIQTYINANGGVESNNMRGTDSALLAASYTAPDNTGISNAESQATTAATQATTAATQATSDTVR